MEKIIKNFTNYSISDDGIIKNIKTNKILKNYIDTKGYLMVKLYNEQYKKGKPFRIHILVVQNFLLDRYDKKELKINHIDGNKLNNSIENLELITQKENIHHAIKNKLIKKKYKCIIQMDKNNNIINTFGMIKDIAKYFNVCESVISQGINKGDYKGFVWKKIENV